MRFPLLAVVTHSVRTCARYKAYRDEQEKLHAAWRKREDARLAAIARGDPNPPAAEADPTAQHEIGILGLLKFLLYLAVGILLAGKFVTGEWGWGLEAGKQLRKIWPTQQRLFSEDLLGKFDGSVAGRPIYLAVRCVFCFFLRVVVCEEFGLMIVRLRRSMGMFMMCRVIAGFMVQEGHTR